MKHLLFNFIWKVTVVNKYIYPSLMTQFWWYVILVAQQFEDNCFVYIKKWMWWPFSAFILTACHRRPLTSEIRAVVSIANKQGYCHNKISRRSQVPESPRQMPLCVMSYVKWRTWTQSCCLLTLCTKKVKPSSHVGSLDEYATCKQKTFHCRVWYKTSTGMTMNHQFPDGTLLFWTSSATESST